MIILVILLGVLAAAIFFVIGVGNLGGAMARRRSLVAGVVSEDLRVADPVRAVGPGVPPHPDPAGGSRASCCSRARSGVPRCSSP